MFPPPALAQFLRARRATAELSSWTGAPTRMSRVSWRYLRSGRRGGRRPGHRQPDAQPQRECLLGLAQDSVNNSIDNRIAFVYSLIVERLENRQAVLQACRQLRQTSEDSECVNLTVSIGSAMKTFPTDNALKAVADDALYLCMCLAEAPGALERLEALTGEQSSFAESNAP